MSPLVPVRGLPSHPCMALQQFRCHVSAHDSTQGVTQATGASDLAEAGSEAQAATPSQIRLAVQVVTSIDKVGGRLAPGPPGRVCSAHPDSDCACLTSGGPTLDHLSSWMCGGVTSGLSIRPACNGFTSIHATRQAVPADRSSWKTVAAAAAPVNMPGGRLTPSGEAR